MTEPNELGMYRGDANFQGEQVEVLAWAYSHEHAQQMADAAIEEWPQVIRNIAMRPALVAESTRFAQVVRPMQPSIYVEIPISWEIRRQVGTRTMDPDRPRGELGP